MNKILTISILIICVCSITSAQYVPASHYLQNPELAIGYVDSCAAFWEQTWDNQSGGFFTNIDKDGTVITGWGTNKNMLTQSRNAYGMVRAYMLTGDTAFLGFARRALNWMYNHAWDTAYGGWFQKLDIDGNPESPTDHKTAFYQHYALLGIIAYYEATGDTTAYNWLMRGYQHLEDYYWDNRSNYFGYYDVTTYNNQNPANKTINSTVDAITTHLLYLYLMTKDNTYKVRLQKMADNIIQHFVASIPQQAIGFVEQYDSDWNWDNSQTMTIMGHVLKAGWCLARLNQLFPDTSYLNNAEILINHVWQNGYDHDFGGPYKDFNRVTGEMLLWGLQDTTKAWWQMEQAIVAGLEMYGQTGQSWYLQMADETINFFMHYFVDHQYGEVYSDRTRYGGFAWNEAKGSDSKAGYHSIETGYYTYLYGNLFYLHNPVVLHYDFDPQQSNREIMLTPLAISDTNLTISNVDLNGLAYSDYNSTSRILSLPAGTGGQFEVTFSPRIINSARLHSASVKDFVLYQNYPNPFNPTTMISWQSPVGNWQSLKVYDILGKEVAILVNEYKPAGKYEIEFSASSLPSGVYIYKLTCGSKNQVKKMLLLK